MAKNKVMIDVVVDDKGTTKRVAVNAKKLGIELDKTGNSARNADRQLKGAAQTSANTTKNFSKMTQGITGGIVPAYAAFAAQIFALSAAFNFLKRAADLENLRRTQVQFAQSTGQAVNTITERLRQASQGMLGFREAAQSAAIGAAKGFSASQLNKLAEGSVKLSARLGRSYEDTYDRLVRGISKAEPELLDELGITLRLENATRRYAQALNLNQGSLTEAQRSQAVYNEALRQMNIQTAGIGDVSANPFQVLLKTFEEIAQTITAKVLPLFTELANFINRNADAAAVAFTALGALILVNIAGLTEGIKGALGSIFGFAGSATSVLGKGVELVGKGVAAAIEPVIQEIKEAEDRLLAAAKDSATKARNAAKTLVGKGAKSTTLQKIAEGIEVTPQALGRLRKDLARVKEEIKETGETSSKAFAGATVDAIEEVEKELETLGRTSLTTGQKIKKGLGVIAVFGVKGLRKSVQLTIGTMRLLGKTASIVGKGINKAMGLAMRGTFILAALQAIFEAFQKINEAPFTFLKNVESVARKVLEVFEGIINFVLKGANKILESLGISFRIPEADLSFLVNNIESASDAALEFLGTSREQLEVQEEQNALAAERTEELAEQLDILKQQKDLILAMQKDLNDSGLDTAAQRLEFINSQSIEDQLKGLEALQNKLKEIRTRETDAMAGGYLGLSSYRTSDQFTQDERDLQDLPEVLSIAQDNIRQTIALLPKVRDDILTAMGGINLDEALSDQNIADFVERFAEMGEGAASAYLKEIASIRDGGQQLVASLGGGNLNEALVAIDASMNSVINAGENAAELGVLSEALKELDEQLAIGGFTDGAVARQKVLQDLVNNRETLADRGRNLSLRQQANRRAPGAVGRQRGIQINADLAELQYDKASQAVAEFIETKKELLKTNEAEYNQQLAQLNRTKDVALQNADIVAQQATEIGQLGVAIGDSLASSMQNAFQGLIQGTMSAKQAFKSMASSILGAIAKIIAELLVAKALTAAFGGGGLFPGVGSFLGIRTGGIVEPVPGYATGGIARGREAGYPAVLHGTEAVVPLPNGKSIPVEMQKGSGQGNNVTVNVTMHSDGRVDQQSDENRTGQLGHMIAAAVQKELQNQKRSGGILNPYGTA